MRRWTIGLAVVAAATPLRAATPEAGPAAHSFAIGPLKAWTLRDGAAARPNDGTLFPGAPTAEVTRLLEAAGEAGDAIPLWYGSLLVRMPGHVVLIDAGPAPTPGRGVLASLALTGIAPDAVTDVLVTHSHPDHVGGLLTAEGASAFPKATIRMSAPEWTFLKANARAEKLVAAIGPQVVPFAPGASPLPGIAAIPLAGHTPGHSGYRIAAGGATLTDIGDSAHSAIVSLARPGWTIQFDTDDAKAKASRETVLARLAASRALVYAPHFPFPALGRIVRAGTGYRWVPADR